MVVVVNVICATCICGQREFEQQTSYWIYLNSGSDFLCLWSWPCVDFWVSHVLRAPIAASLSEGSCSEVLLACPLDTQHRPGWFWQSASQESPGPDGGSTGWSFSTLIWLLSRPRGVGEVSSLFFPPLKQNY